MMIQWILLMNLTIFMINLDLQCSLEMEVTVTSVTNAKKIEYYFKTWSSIKNPLVSACSRTEAPAILCFQDMNKVYNRYSKHRQADWKINRGQHRELQRDERGQTGVGNPSGFYVICWELIGLPWKNHSTVTVQTQVGLLPARQEKKAIWRRIIEKRIRSQWRTSDEKRIVWEKWNCENGSCPLPQHAETAFPIYEITQVSTVCSMCALSVTRVWTLSYLDWKRSQGEEGELEFRQREEAEWRGNGTEWWLFKRWLFKQACLHGWKETEGH